MDRQLIAEIFTSALGIIGLIFGFFRMNTKKMPLYFTMILLSEFTGTLVYLFRVVYKICSGSEPLTFNVSAFAVMGSFLFLFFANYGEMDMLADDKSKALKKYRIIPLIIVLAFVITDIAVFAGQNINLFEKIIFLVTIFVIMLAAYYNMKHLIIPDVEGGIIKAMRGYNFVALLYEILSVAIIFTQVLGDSYLRLAITPIIGLCLLIMVIIADREVEKWKT